MLKLHIHRRRSTLANVCLLIFILLSATAVAQVAPFASVPAHLRARLITRFNCLIQSQISRDWGDQYDLLGSYLTSSTEKADYVREQQRLEAKGLKSELVRFEIQSATYASGDAPFDAVIRGCGTFKEGKQIVRLSSIAEGYYEKGNWFFTPITPDVQVGGPAPPCASGKSKSR